VSDVAARSAVAAESAAARAGAALFELPARGVVELHGADRVRWLDGMVSGDVKALSASGPRSGCHALILTREGRIVAEVHVLARPESLLLELERDAVAPALAHLARYVVADDVELADRSDRYDRLALEGPAAAAVLAAAAGAPLALADDAAAEVAIAGRTALAAAYSLSGLPAVQLLAPAGEGPALRDALLAAGRAQGVVAASAETLELLRVEQGVPRYGRELTLDALPAEVRLERAVSETKGCYTGQEVVTRMRSRGRVGHLLVGLRFDAPGAATGAPLRAGGREVGSVTSVAASPRWGAIGLGFVRAADAQPGTALDAEGVAARVSELPFVADAA
jgi:folate-binding protein YgfZ